MLHEADGIRPKARSPLARTSQSAGEPGGGLCRGTIEFLAFTQRRADDQRGVLAVLFHVLFRDHDYILGHVQACQAPVDRLGGPPAVHTVAHHHQQIQAAVWPERAASSRSEKHNPPGIGEGKTTAAAGDDDTTVRVRLSQ